ncbi:MAG TPA: type VI secretion system tip protein TssI/VgrG, partial [Myxococcaceae bacterium]|nr:type VI secretion system tip protein TssI/VgrG [Myxococcaceae bacterium]
LERLMHVRRSRIFQGKSTADIVKAVLSEGGVEHRWAASGSYAPREYCVQYRESDFDFISRLMEWEGLFYFFEHAADKHTLVIGDSAGAFSTMPGGAKLPFRERTGQVPAEEHVAAFSLAHRVRSAAVMTRDFDFKKPSLDLTATSDGGAFTGLETYDYAEGYVAPGDGKRLAKARLQEAQRDTFTHAGESACPRLCPGFAFELEEAPAGLAGKYVPVRVRHEGSRPERPGTSPVLDDGLYRNEVLALADGVPFRPSRRTPRPVVPGIQTAVVVGPGGEEIHPDEYGRIKVQFHWDRHGAKDDKSSCWIRVAQVWGGPAWGGLFLPRIGQEVVVRFLEGDPDRPLITGAVYNGANTPPYPLPDEKTKSTLKSNSSLGGDGFNEFRIEDAAGQEEIFVHGQKDETLVTENNKSQEVRGYEDLLVKKDRKKTVEGNQMLSVGVDDVGVIGGSQSLRVIRDRRTATGGDHMEAVTGNQSVTVSRNRDVKVVKVSSDLVGAAAALTVGAGYAVNVALAKSVSVGGLAAEQVGGAWLEYVLGSREERVDANASAKVGGNFQTEVKGQITQTAGKDLKGDIGGKSQSGIKLTASLLAKEFTLKADTFNLVVNDKLILKVVKSGDIKLNATSVTLDGSDIKFKGSKIKKVAAGSLSDQSVKPDKIEPVPASDPQAVEFQLKGADGKPMANMDYEVRLQDGSIKKGKTDGSGKAKVDNVPEGKVLLVFPKLEGELAVNR